MLSVRNVSRAMSDLGIKDISFEVLPGQYFVLLGPSGAGKSVLLETIAGLARHDSGWVFLDGEDISDKKIQERNIAMVFQNSTLFPHMTIYDNIAYPLRCRKLSNSQVYERVMKLADAFSVDSLLTRKPLTLSGGETQRVCLARAVAAEPKCLLLDEPMSSLDVESRAQIRMLLRKINTQGRAVIHVTHDYDEAACLATHIAVMEKGRIVQAGAIEEVFQRPESEFVARFIGIRNVFRGQLKKRGERQTDTRQFDTGGFSISVLTDSLSGAGCVMIRSEDVTIANAAGRTSARNNFEGTIVDILSAGIGVEVVVDIGIRGALEIVALVTSDSVKELDLKCGKKVWVSFKASAVKYIE